MRYGSADRTPTGERRAPRTQAHRAVTWSAPSRAVPCRSPPSSSSSVSPILARRRTGWRTPPASGLAFVPARHEPPVTERPGTRRSPARRCGRRLPGPTRIGDLSHRSPRRAARALLPLRGLRVGRGGRAGDPPRYRDRGRGGGLRHRSGGARRPQRGRYDGRGDPGRRALRNGRLRGDRARRRGHRRPGVDAEVRGGQGRVAPGTAGAGRPDGAAGHVGRGGSGGDDGVPAAERGAPDAGDPGRGRLGGLRAGGAAGGVPGAGLVAGRSGQRGARAVQGAGPDGADPAAGPRGDGAGAAARCWPCRWCRPRRRWPPNSRSASRRRPRTRRPRTRRRRRPNTRRPSTGPEGRSPRGDEIGVTPAPLNFALPRSVFGGDPTDEPSDRPGALSMLFLTSG
ncbi:hypothetical protein SBADM41S_04978 [Streptomyces badius]